MISTKDLYMKACMQSTELHAMTSEERVRLQGHLRMMYLEIEKICDRHGLRMCTGYGTVLGAIRHQGFIPWDDDMDLLMPREDYDKLINNFADELPYNYRIYAPNSKHGPITRFAKVVDTNTRFLDPSAPDDESHGIFIDIFPLEGTSSNKLFIKFKHVISCLMMLIASSVMEYENSLKDGLYKRLMCSTPKGTRVYYIRHCIGFLCGLLKSKTWFNLIDNYTKCKSVKAGYSVPIGGASMKYFQPMDKDIFFPAKKMKFDNIEVYVPNCPELHCELEYGDWKWIPPVEKRWQHFLKEIRF